MAENLIPQPLLDWYGVWPGQTGIDEKNEMWVQDMPVGVRLAVQEARSSEIFIKAERPWEERTVSPFTVVHEDGKLKLWYYSCGGDKEDRTFVAYAESEDGFQWQRPELGLQEYRGSKANNLLLGIDDFEMQAVFVDPSSPPDERYKALGRDALCFHKGVAVPKMTHERKWELRREMEEAGYTLDQMNAELQFHGLLLGAVSPDGWQWTVLEEPLLNVGQTQLDSQNIAAYDPDTRQYLGYLRGHQDRRRTVRRTEGKEFRDWNPTHDVFGMDPQDPQGDDVYTSGYCRCPGSGRHLMFPAIYHRLTSAVDVQLASSRDGVLWSRPERKPIISCEAGDDRYLTLYAFPNLVPLSEEEWGLMFNRSVQPARLGQSARSQERIRVALGSVETGPAGGPGSAGAGSGDLDGARVHGGRVAPQLSDAKGGWMGEGGAGGAAGFGGNQALRPGKAVCGVWPGRGRSPLRRRRLQAGDLEGAQRPIRAQRPEGIYPPPSGPGEDLLHRPLRPIVNVKTLSP